MQFWKWVLGGLVLLAPTTQVQAQEMGPQTPAIKKCPNGIVVPESGTCPLAKKRCANGASIPVSNICPYEPSKPTPLEARAETRIAEKGFVSPPAKIADVAWMIGGWGGAGIEGAQAYENWLPPSGSGTMVGTFVQEKGDGSILFTEHMYLMEENGSLVVKLKHFGPDLKSWEEKDDMVSFRLIAVEPCAVYFSALTYRCVDKDAGSKSGMVVAVRMQSEGAEINELSFRFNSTAKAAGVSRCPDAITTVEMNQCFGALFMQADERRAQYLASALERYDDRPELAEKIAASDAAFLAYRDAECGTVLENWKDGTIRGVMTLSCRIDMTNRRTHTIWQNWLTYMDSTPPVLPEPEPVR